MELFSEIFKIYKRIIYISIIVLAITVWCAIYIGGVVRYDQNVFDIKLNNTVMRCFYDERYTHYFNKLGDEGYNYIDNIKNEVPLNEVMNLEISEYEIYKNDYRIENNSSWEKRNDYKYIKVENNIRLVIMRKNKVLYNGKYISDVSDFLNENGRYYIHIYNTRNDGFFEKVKTHISFNVVVGGGNYE